jgi:hypothetical protein
MAGDGADQDAAAIATCAKTIAATAARVAKKGRRERIRTALYAGQGMTVTLPIMPASKWPGIRHP